MQPYIQAYKPHPLLQGNAYGYWKNKAKTSLYYSTFGAPMPGLTYQNGNAYRFGFNGQEKDDEIAGAGNHTTAEFWEYDARLGRRWNRDPRSNAYESPYSCFSNNPIYFADPKGDTTWAFDKQGGFLGVIYDQLANETHFINKSDYDNAVKQSKNINDPNASAKNVRDKSYAFYTAATEKKMKAAYDKFYKNPNNSAKELLFGLAFQNVKTPRSSKELEFIECKTCLTGSTESGSYGQPGNLFTENPDRKFFLTGHSHPSSVPQVAFPTNPKSVYARPEELNLFTNNLLKSEYTGGVMKYTHELKDYRPFLDHQHPAMILSHKGITIYPTLPPGQSESLIYPGGFNDTKSYEPHLIFFQHKRETSYDWQFRY